MIATVGAEITGDLGCSFVGGSNLAANKSLHLGHTVATQCAGGCSTSTIHAARVNAVLASAEACCWRLVTAEPPYTTCIGPSKLASGIVWRIISGVAAVDSLSCAQVQPIGLQAASGDAAVA